MKTFFSFSLENASTLFRGNCLASKIISSYSVTVGKGYLKQLLEEPINSVIHEGEKYEVNPLKLPKDADLETNIEYLRNGLKTFMEAIFSSIDYCPLYVFLLFCFFIYIYLVTFITELLEKFVMN